MPAQPRGSRVPPWCRDGDDTGLNWNDLCSAFCCVLQMNKTVHWNAENYVNIQVASVLLMKNLPELRFKEIFMYLLQSRFAMEIYTAGLITMTFIPQVEA